jgi:starch phosphorylase
MTTVTKQPLAATSDLAGYIARHAEHSLAKTWDELAPFERLLVVALAVRDRCTEVAIATERRYRQAGSKHVYYLSLECLLGRLLANNLTNLGMMEECEAAVRSLGGDLADVIATEPDAGLGNGGLGRLAACLLDSLATLGMPGYGYCLNYSYGLFKQDIRDGQQIEKPDDWQRYGAPWEIELAEEAIPIPLFGRVDYAASGPGVLRPRLADFRIVMAVPNDLPIVGFGGKTVNMVRLFSARALQDFDIESFDEGHYIAAVHQKDEAETITKVLYPNDCVPHGTELRLTQEYFLVTASLRDILNRLGEDFDIRRLPDCVAVHMNDTHPSLAVAELMRILVDEKSIPWEEAWDLTVNTMAFTNHTLMPEALERWPVDLMGKVLPRHLEIIYEINRRFLEQVGRSHPGDVDRLRRMSLIEEGPVKRVRMAHLAIVGSHSVNGVAQVHSELIKTQLVPDFHEMWPERFNNKTNGVTPRRWLRLCNPALARLISDALGDAWITDLDELRGLEPLSGDAGFQEQFGAVKRQNKQRLSRVLADGGETPLDPASLIDAHVKRIHEYKRQLLHVLYAAWQYLRIVDDGDKPDTPRTHLFAGKAAPGYQAAKQIIHVITSLADTINADRRCDGLLRVVFAPDYRVSLAEAIVPAADLSEQISTAGTEASGTSNMKFAMNGAITIGTLDGANIEIREKVDADNLLIFGNTVDQIHDLQRNGVPPREFYQRSPTVRRIMDAFASGRLTPLGPWVFQRLVDSWDPFFHLADLEAYLDAQAAADRLYADTRQWTRKAILNVARIGYFSSDRTVREYAADIWRIKPVA